MENDSSDRLDSWKDIAAYLRKDVRTCQRWHRDFGLPVRRYVDSSRSRIFADKREIDEWLRSRGNQGQIKDPDSNKFSAWRYIVSIGIIILVAGAYYFLNRMPYAFMVEDDRIIFMDKRGRTLLDYDSQIPKLGQFQNEAFSNGIVNDFEDSRFFPWIMINAQKPLFNWGAALIPPTSDGSFADIICYVSRYGRLCWTYRTELEIVRGFLSRDIDGDGRIETIVLSMTKNESASEIAILDEGGNPKAKFLHPGALFDFICKNVVGDSKEEIIAVGEYQPKNLPALVVLELDKLYSIRPPQADAPPEELIGASEYYVLFPDDPIERTSFRRQALRRIFISNDSHGEVFIARNLKKFRVSLHEGLIDVSPMLRYRLFFPAPPSGSEQNNGLYNHLNRLKVAGVLFFDGFVFVDHPSRVSL